MKSTILLRMVIVLSIIAFSFSVKAQSDHSEVKENSEISSDRVYIKIEIMGLACPYCAFGMEKELKEVAGVDKVDIELKTGLAYISTPKELEPNRFSLEKIITDSGFSVGKIEYQDKPFEKLSR